MITSANVRTSDALRRVRPRGPRLHNTTNGSALARTAPVLLSLWLAAACAAGVKPQKGRHIPRSQPPRREQPAELPETERLPQLEPAALVHVMRGLYFVQAKRPAAAVPHLRLALIYAPDSPFIHERLSEAWAASGHTDKAAKILARGLRRTPNSPWLNALAGRRAVQRQEFAVGVEHLKKAVRHDSVMAEVAGQLVDALLWLGRQQEADASARGFIQRAAAHAGLARRIAQAFEDHGRLAEAATYYAKATRQAPNNRAGLVGHVRVLELAGDAAAAAAVLTDGLAHFATDVPLYVELTRLLREASSSEASTYRREALRQAGERPEARLQVARGDLEAGEREAGIRLLTALVEAYPDRPRLFVELARAQRQNGDAAACIESLQEAPAGVPEPHVELARCQAVAGALEAALMEVRRAVRLGWRLGEALQLAAQVLTHSSHWRGASRRYGAFLERLDIAADANRAQLGWVILASHFGRGTRAIDRLEAMVREQPQNARWRIRLASLHREYGSTQRALQLLHALHAETPRSSAVLNALGFTLVALDRELDAAEVYLRRAHRFAGGQSHIVDSLGWLAYKRGDLATALRLLKRAARGAPGSAEILWHLGRALAESEQWKKSKRTYERALRANPRRYLRRKLRESMQELGRRAS